MVFCSIPWVGRPSSLVLLGFVTSVVGVASLYTFPASGHWGLNAVVVLQCLAVFGGMATMVVAAPAVGAPSRREELARLRAATSDLIGFGIVWALAYAITPGLSFFVALLLAQHAGVGIRRVGAWLGAA